jgi:tetratricopeptide (TPR) repeat protein
MDKRFEQSLFLRARSYEYLSWRDPSYRRQAITAYEVYLKAYPSEPNSDEAALSLFTMKATSVNEALAAYDTMVTAHPRAGHRGEMLLRIGILQEKSDSAGALGTYTTILRDHATSPAAQEASYRRFALLLEIGRIDSAVVEGERYSTRYPNGDHTAEIIARLGMVALMSNDPARAVELFSTLLNEFEYTSAASDARQHLAESYALEGKYDESISLYNEIVAFERTNPFYDGNPGGELLLAQAKVYRSAGKPSGARRALFNLLEQEPQASLTGEVYGLLGLLAKDEGDIALATAYFQQAGTASPDVATTREVADLLFEAGAYADAVRQYKLLTASSKSETEKKYLEAQTIRALLRSDDLQNAQKAMTAFAKKYKDSAEDLASFELEKGNYFFRKEDYKNARSTYDIVKDKYDATASAADAMYWTGKVLEATDKPKDAVKEFENLLKEYPSSLILPRARLALGNISYNSERWDDAIKHYKSVVDDRSADASLVPFAMSNLIEAYEAAGIFDAALDWTRKYLDRFPSSEDSFDKKIKIGILYQRLGYYDQSIVHLQSLIDEAGSELEGEIRYYIAEANFQKGDFQQAILDYLKVPYLVTKKGKIDWTANSLYMAGQSYEKLGRHDQALAMYQQIMDRPGIDETFKAAAKKEIDRVKLVLKKSE